MKGNPAGLADAQAVQPGLHEGVNAVSVGSGETGIDAETVHQGELGRGPEGGPGRRHADIDIVAQPRGIEADPASAHESGRPCEIRLGKGLAQQIGQPGPDRIVTDGQAVEIEPDLPVPPVEDFSPRRSLDHAVEGQTERVDPDHGERGIRARTQFHLELELVQMHRLLVDEQDQGSALHLQSGGDAVESVKMEGEEGPGLAGGGEGGEAPEIEAGEADGAASAQILQ
ncbi:MAG: hypothetical protein BWY77_00403 [bacterium ADurb.Bin431]|nr:MAG: hypothetical protein BWY77_00403 [bacterium ADurb.Bin431]